MCMTSFRVKKSVKENTSVQQNGYATYMNFAFIISVNLKFENSISFEKAILNLRIFHHSPTIFDFL